jgi:vacuolar-type H+-ATPase subunit F/Vma7
MHVRLLSGAHDVTGFALAGVDSEECRTRAELLDALDRARRDPEIGIVVVSPELAALAGDAIEALRDSPHLPITIVLPDLPDAERAAQEAEP